LTQGNPENRVVKEFMCADKTIPHYYPNQLGRILLLSLEEIIGRNGITTVLNTAQLSDFIENYPPKNLDLQFGYGHVSKIMIALEKVYGQRGGRGFARRAGYAAFKYGLREFGPSTGVSSLSFRLLPWRRKMRSGLNTLADTLNRLAGQCVRVEEQDDRFLWYTDPCPLCHERKTIGPVCQFIAGVLEEMLFWLSGSKYFIVNETQCVASGDPTCLVVIDKKPLE
jgi:predicted hydrocarbon binding protein